MTAAARVVGRVADLSRTVGRRARLLRGKAVGDSADGWVEALIDGQTWPVADPTRRVKTGDALTVALQGNTRTLATNDTDVGTPAPSPTKIATTATNNTTVNSTVSSGAYAWTDGTQMGTYAADIAAVTRSLAGDINQLRADVAALKNALNGNATLANTGGGRTNQLMDAIATKGIITTPPGA